jgi:hypothetical protein
MKVTSAAFSAGGPIPTRFTCDGEDVSPELTWTNAPPETSCFVLVLHDPDAPKAGGFTHWLVYNIPATVTRIAENVPHNASLPGIGTQGRNDSGKIGYLGPCPPSGTHRYFFRLYALNQVLDVAPGVTHRELVAAMAGQIIGQAELMGTYTKGAQRAA